MPWPTIYDTKLDEYDAMELPGQQIAAAHADSPLNHFLNLDIQAPPACQRLTGIMASLGKSTSDVETLEKMMEAGMNIACLNMSFGTREEHVETIKLLREAMHNFSITMGKIYPLAIAMRLSGRKIRTGRIAESYGESVELKPETFIRLTTDETYRDRCSTYAVYVDFMYLAEQLKKGDIILLDNESIKLKVDMISATTLTCKIERGGFLGSFKDVFIPHVVLNMSNYSEKDKLDIQMAINNQVDMIIAPFVNCAESITELKGLLGLKGKKILIIANIQTIQGCLNFDNILQAANGIIITRQELGSDITPKKLVVAQKCMVAKANQAGIPVGIEAHLLRSMTHKQIPLRSELLDVSNCILDGSDFLVLGPETAVGMYPVETIMCLSNACKEAEACLWSKQLLSDFIDKTPLPCDQATGTSIAAALATQRCMAAAIIIISTSGQSAQIIAKYRPRCPIIAITRHHSIARQLHLCRAVIPLIYEDAPDCEWSRDVEKRIHFGVKWAMEKGFIRVGDPIVTISGWKQGSGSTNAMRVMYASSD